MKVVPNCITLVRIFLALALLFLKPLSSAFLEVYLLCGFTDLIDGFIARKTGVTSSFGAKLDSAADTVLIAVSLFTLYPYLGLTPGVLLWICIIGIIRVASIMTALYKFKTYASIHTYGNKLTGILLFITPLWLSSINHIIWITVVCIVANLSAVEELIIQITSHQLKLDKKGLFIIQEKKSHSG
jgi:phosphatidylglycerophosphate synthase